MSLSDSMVLCGMPDFKLAFATDTAPRRRRNAIVGNSLHHPDERGGIARRAVTH